ncbi:MAG: tRNA lysidine(34) synthetase TilS, partial [bacterium]
SEEDERFVRELCETWGIPLAVGGADVAAEAKARGMGLEACGRLLRYAFFRRIAEGGLIATAHNAEDNLETMLLHLARGAGLRGLGGIAEKRGQLIRPLLCLTRAEIESALAQRGIPHREDSSNASELFARNRLRHQALPALRSVNPRCAEASLSAAALLREDEAFLSGLAEAFLRENLRENALPAEKLLAAPPPVAKRALRLLLGDGAGAGHLEAVLRLAAAASPSAAVSVPGHRVTRRYGLLLFDEAAGGALADTPILPGSATPLPGTGWVVHAAEERFSGIIHKSFTTFPFKKAAVCGTISIGSRRSGDSIRLNPGSGAKTLKKLFIEKKIPLRQRESLPVIRDERGVLAVLGIGCDVRVRANPGEEVITLRFEETLC